ncbi:CinA family protein [Alphaproteobacteria bacterium KMM 3653]|uniref:CinA family protein n=1 Tax=Harenicola maris TaxID=2841044 RepID=A0AAP2CN77_9RHOB|nr:CinA family protein [Harenicola maris]
MTRAETLVARARDAGLMIATAESCTGGLVAGAITDIPGSSAVFERGLVTYSNTAKQSLLGVEGATLTAHGAVSEEVAIEMAEGALRRSDADLTVSVTGIAGPGGSEHKPEGRVCFARAGIGIPTIAITVEFGPRGRAAVRQASVAQALDLLIDALPEGAIED